LNLSDAVKNISFNRAIKLKDERSSMLNDQKLGFLHKVSTGAQVKELEKRIGSRRREQENSMFENAADESG
jgi:hypothetical protein